MEKDMLYYSRKLKEGESLQCAKRNIFFAAVVQSFMHMWSPLRSLLSEIRNVLNMRPIGRITGPHFQSK